MGEVKSLLTPAEFVLRAVGVPWRRWQSSWDCVDCFGLLVLYHREVLGVELGEVPQTEIAQGFERSQGWEACRPEAGATCFMAWRNGSPSHCGILLSPREVLHAEGGAEHPGSVRVSRLDAVRRVYGEIRFYRYASC